MLLKIPKKSGRANRQNAGEPLMPQMICPRCTQRVNFADHSGDLIHACNSGTPTLDQEDVTIIGSSVVEFGSTVNTGVKPQEVMRQGMINKFQGTLPGIEGEHFGGVTRRGANKNTHRQRQHYEHFELGGK